MDLRIVGNDEHPPFDSVEHAYYVGQLQGAVDERERLASIRRPPAHRFIRPRTRRRWLPSLVSFAAATGLTLGVVALWGPGGNGNAPIDNHAQQSIVLEGGDHGPAPAPTTTPSKAPASHTTTKAPVAGQGGTTTGETVQQGTSAGDGSAATARDQATQTKPRTTGAGKSAGKSAATSGGSSSGKTTTPAKPVTKPTPTPKPTTPSTTPTPAPTRQALVPALVGGLSTTVGDLGSTLTGTVGGLLGQG